MPTPDANKADPAAIDLKAIQSWSTQVAPIPELIAAVEALRECVAELEAELAKRPQITVREYDREPFTIEE